MPHVTETTGEKQRTSDNEDFEQFVSLHLNMLRNSGIPVELWPALHNKLREQIFDAGKYFKMQCYMESEADEEDQSSFTWKVEAVTNLEVHDPNSVFLIDHAWTYRTSTAREQLHSNPAHLNRMAALMGVNTKNKTPEEIEENALQEMWKFNQTYHFGHLDKGSEDSMPMWYVMDEFGSRIQHSDTPNCRAVPMFYVPMQVTFTILWPLHTITAGEEITRNYVESQSLDENTRLARLLPWEPCDFRELGHEQEEPNEEYFQMKRRVIKEEPPNLEVEFRGLPKDRNVKVYLENYKVMAEHLTDSRFEIVNTKEEADILWIYHHFKGYKALSEETPSKMINQFPCEMVVTSKDVLAVVSRRMGNDIPTDPETLEKVPAWLPVTYNLELELPEFVSYFQHRADKGLDNHWICKPWNLARGMDMHITNNINHIVRLPDSGPKVACKYVEDPVLFMREDIGNVKFDIRHIVLLSSVQPLKLYVYKVFWLRFANKPFSLDHFDDYEKHFTVMNYVEEGTKLKQVHYDEFIPMFDSQYPAYKWEIVEESIFQMFREIFQAATAKPSPMGFGHSPQSRAQYAIDFLLKWSTNSKGERYIQPVVCEVNYMPDCDRAMKYHPHFANDIFSTLFLDDPEGHNVTQLL